MGLIQYAPIIYIAHSACASLSLTLIMGLSIIYLQETERSKDMFMDMLASPYSQYADKDGFPLRWIHRDPLHSEEHTNIHIKFHDYISNTFGFNIVGRTDRGKSKCSP
ncbi:hypothetical protein DPMN_027412 [Dreissena polymorpha]|uniref:Uncharacterized protein n=1 Tax=Dreissena polymorpha TaxID=45954 RepID=A0A9D4LSY6_DREPO|nr:hypothetical protein DPMN_027412 [Dreissena polymorpha]